MSEIKLNLLNRLHLIWEIITTRSGHKHSSSSKQLSTFQQGYSAGVYDERYNTKELKRQLEDHKKLVSLMVELKAEKDKLGKLTISLEIDELVEQLKEKGDDML